MGKAYAQPCGMLKFLVPLVYFLLGDTWRERWDSKMYKQWAPRDRVVWSQTVIRVNEDDSLERE